MNEKAQRRLSALIPILFFFLAVALCLATAEKTFAESAQRIQGKKVAMIIAYRNFQDTEFKVPKKMFEKEGALITVVSSKMGKAVGMKGSKAQIDLLIDDVNVANFNAIVFIGGMGVRGEYWENPKAHAVAREAVKQGKILAAICWGPVILANAGALEGKKGTVATSGGTRSILKKKGCKYSWSNVVVDGNIITANGPSAAKAFARAVIESLE